MAEQKAAQKSGFSAGDIVGAILEANPGLLQKLLGMLLGLFNRAPKKPVDPPTEPVGGDSGDDFPDDTIPAPKELPIVAKVRLKLSRVQLSKQRFPDAYTAQNPFGLMNAKEIEEGDAMPYGSKFWLDLTAYDSKGKEILRDRVLANGLAYQTEHHCGDAFIIGHGGSSQNPTAGYETNDTNEIGNGITAWISSEGFLHQMKAHGEGTFECWGKVNGIESNHFTLKVS